MASPKSKEAKGGVPRGYSRLPEELLTLGKRRTANLREKAEIDKEIPGMVRRAVMMRNVSISTCAHALGITRQNLTRHLVKNHAEWLAWFSNNLGTPQAGSFYRDNGRMPTKAELEEIRQQGIRRSKGEKG